MKVAYYKGCLASLSAKELDSSTKALAPKLGIELEELESVTCCGAGDIHEAEPDYYLHLNARILAYAEATGADTLMTICNVCTLNLRQANFQLQNDDALRERVSDNLETVGAPRYSGGVEVKHLLWLIADGEGYEKLKEVAHKGLKGLKVAPFYGCQASSERWQRGHGVTITSAPASSDCSIGWISSPSASSSRAWMIGKPQHLSFAG